MIIFLIIMLWLLLDFFDHKSNVARYDERVNVLDKELWDMERHNEIVEFHKIGNAVNYQELLLLEHIVKKLHDMPTKDSTRCKQALRYIKQAKDGSVEAFEAVKEFVAKEHWVNDEKDT